LSGIDLTGLYLVQTFVITTDNGKREFLCIIDLSKGKIETSFKISEKNFDGCLDEK